MKSDKVASRQSALIPVYGVVDKKPRPLDQELIIVGRARGCDIVLEAPEVSSLHCVIHRVGDVFRLRDCASRTGTRINGDPRRAAPLHDGDILQIGPFSFNVSLPGDDPAQAPMLTMKERQHLQRSRRRLAEIALRLRHRLHQVLNHDPDTWQENLKKKASGLRKLIRGYDQRFQGLEAAERDLATDREALTQAQEAHAARVEHVEAELAVRLALVDADIHQRWQDFQKRCQIEERRLQQAAVAAERAVPTAELLSPSPQRIALDEEHRAMEEARKTLDRDHQELHHMRDQSAQEQATLHAQRQQLHAMIGQLKELQAAIRQEQAVDVPGLTRENEQLRKQLADAEARMAVPAPDGSDVALANHCQLIEQENLELRRLLSELEQQPRGANPDLQRQCQELREENEQLRGSLTEWEDAGGGNGSETAPGLRQENELLRKLLHEKDSLFEQMKEKVVAASAAKQSFTASDLESYEAEINQFRQQLEGDRAKLGQEIEQLRQRNQELDEATREMEMEMSRERAELARERQRLDRMRDEVRSEMERMNRDGAVRDSLAPVQKLRDEMKGGGKAGDAVRSLRNRG